MDEEYAAARADTSGEFGSGPTLTPVRRRGESHLLALLLAVAVVFVATAIAKPWGEGAPPGTSAATTSLVAEITTPASQSTPPPEASATTESMPAETDQPVFIVVQSGDSYVTFSGLCTEDPGVSPSLPGSAESVMGPGVVALICTNANVQRVESVLPSPSAP